MLHRNASLLSLIGSTCIVKSKAQPPLAFSPTPNQPPLSFPWVRGATFWCRPSCRLHCRDWTLLLSRLTFLYMSNSVQWDCITCPVPWYWNLSGSGLDVDFDMPCEHKQNCTVRSQWSVMSGHDSPWMQGKIIIISYITFSTRVKLHKGRIPYLLK